MTSYYFRFITVGHFLNNGNFNEPVQPFLDIWSDMSSSAFFKRSYFYLKNIIYNSDNGIVLNDEILEHKTVYHSDKTIMDFRDSKLNNGKILYQFTMTFNPNGIEETIKRTYKKIQNIMAEVGGIIKVITMICVILLYSYNKISYYDNISNELVRISENEHDRINTVIKNNYNSYNNFLKDATTHPNVSSNVKTESGNITRVRPTKVTFKRGAIKSLLFFFTPCFYNKRKDKLFKMIVSLINKKIDILSIIKNGLDVERIQKILFDADQQKLIKYPHRMIITNEICENSVLVENDSVQILNRIKSRTSNDVMNKRFVEVIETDIMK